MVSHQDIETRKSKRGHVLAELLETERIYVAEMGSILRVSNFYALFIPCALSHMHLRHDLQLKAYF